MSKVNRNFKAGVFTHLFGEPEKELELYNAFSSVQFPPDTPVVDLTLTDALYMDRVNDLSFSIGDKLVVFFEHQSTPNENMPLRDLIYCGRIYEKLIDNAVMYSEKRVMIPEPEFYVLYNGVKPFPEQTVYRLSDSYNRRNVSETALDLTVTVYNVNKGHNEDIVRRSESLYGYILLVAKAREYEQNGLERAKAVERAIKECIEQEILTEYLRNNGSEVSNMLLQEWKIEDAKAVWQREAEERSDRKWQSVILQKDAILADKDAVLADKDAEIAKLRALLDRK